ncbi:hypothetical protein QWI17_04345 [Gilvimarinus sp. SDUM040013]|uniref:Uncharacterized protein n=1 Tax=Gilvimarinus gilvus TaxID=3058038 RepID=A0ABU4RU89_9GAMM|nr:hypothetical protein [Gilvimarinus sp. SDUM040013]MDO3385068.1 hypothetical protein [Gilvimarinus sp. SDUM040013]MDX6848443.1 hypothetical protein [Gilvimarinus sp. SDUM040013]
MEFYLVGTPTLAGSSGLEQLKQLQGDMYRALAEQDYARVRQLDETCATVVDGLMSANSDNTAILVEALLDLKSVYRQMLTECDRLSRQRAVG